jgi:YfiH family protein
VFCFHEADGVVGAAFTDRHGGVSAAPFDSLNLGTATADDPAAVARNYDLLAEAIGVEPKLVARMRQVHGAEVAVVREPPDPDAPPEADAMVTDVASLVLCVRVADCVPVLLADPEARVVGCAHAGRSGLVAGVVPKAVEAMRGLGAGRIRAWVGPHVCGGCYEVPRQMQDDVGTAVPEARATTTWGTPALDIGAGVRAQLRQAGCEVVAVPRRCTREDADLYSHRRDGDRSGRSAGLVWLRS